mgnify:FL=1
MSEFQELIKSFPKTREYVHDFFVYGFKTRNEFKGKSPRTYDNERRRLESWLSSYVRKDHASSGSNISLAIDSSLLDTNPLFRVWKTKSLTDNDIVLHFLILNLLQDGRPLTAEAITDLLLSKYNVLFDLQTVRRKCNAYEKEGLLDKQRLGKTVVFSLSLTLPQWLRSNENVLDALFFYQMAEVLGIIGNELTDHLDCQNRTFRVKHSFCVHTLEDEILLDLLNAMNGKFQVELKLKSSRTETKTTSVCVPLQIFISARTGRRYLCGYLQRKKRFSCFRLDSVKSLTPLAQSPDYDVLLEKLDHNRRHLWGVSFQGEAGHRLDKLTMILQAMEPAENYIVDRLKREGRGGTVTRLARNVYQYEIEVFDCNEMLPWLRTFIGRILKLTCTAKSIEQKFYRDLQKMYEIYGISQNIP